MTLKFDPSVFGALPIHADVLAALIVVVVQSSLYDRYRCRVVVPLVRKAAALAWRSQARWANC